MVRQSTFNKAHSCGLQSGASFCWKLGSTQGSRTPVQLHPILSMGSLAYSRHGGWWNHVHPLASRSRWLSGGNLLHLLFLKWEVSFSLPPIFIQWLISQRQKSITSQAAKKKKKKGSHQLLEYSITWAHYAERVSYDSVLEKFTVHLNRHLYQQMKTWRSFIYHEAFHRLLWDHRVRGKDPACRNMWRLHRRDTVCSKTSTCAHLITAVFLSC